MRENCCYIFVIQNYSLELSDISKLQLWTTDYGLWNCGLWTMGYENMDCGLWNYGLWAMELWTIESTMDYGLWAMQLWTMRLWTMDHGYMDYGLWTTKSQAMDELRIPNWQVKCGCPPRVSYASSAPPWQLLSYWQAYWTVTGKLVQWMVAWDIKQKRTTKSQAMNEFRVSNLAWSKKRRNTSLTMDYEQEEKEKHLLDCC